MYNYVIIFLGDNMKKRFVKKFNMEVSELGFGAWQLGSPGDFFDEMDIDYGVNLVREAYHKGVTFFDTAPGYSDGNSEVILGKALKDVRSKVFINTKVGHGPNGINEFSVEGINTSIHRSLERLQTDYLDSVILHNPEKHILEGKSELIETLKSHKEKGTIKGYGVSIDTLEELQLVLNNLDVDTIEIMFNIIHQEPKELFHEINKKGILLIIKIPFDSGWLTGRFNHKTKFTGIRSRWPKDVKENRNKIVERIKDITGKEDLVPDALQFILKYNEVSTVIPGIRKVEYLNSNLEALTHVQSDEVHIELEKLYDEYIKNIHTPW